MVPALAPPAPAPASAPPPAPKAEKKRKETEPDKPKEKKPRPPRLPKQGKHEDINDYQERLARFKNPPPPPRQDVPLPPETYPVPPPFSTIPRDQLSNYKTGRSELHLPYLPANERDALFFPARTPEEWEAERQRRENGEPEEDEDEDEEDGAGKPRMHGGNKELLLEMFSKMLDMYQQMKNKGYDDEDDYIGNALQEMLEEIQNDAITIEQLRKDYDELKWAYEHICLVTGEEKEEIDEKEEPPATGDGRNRFRPHRGS